MAGVYVVRRFVLTAIPEVIDLGMTSISKDALILVSFAVVILTAGLSMLAKNQNTSSF